MIEIVLGITGVVFGGLLSWVITHQYYRRSLIDLPDRARSLIEHLPDSPCSLDQLTELYQDTVPVTALEGICAAASRKHHGNAPDAQRR